MNKQLVITGVEITTDSEGRFNLNALHKASGGAKKDRPGYWLVLESTQELIKELENQRAGETAEISAIRTIEGRNGGTFAHELLAISYAGWISARFQLQVNQVFLDYKTGKYEEPKKEQAPTTQRTSVSAFEYVKRIEQNLPNLGESALQQLYSEASEIDFGRRLIPLPVVNDDYYTATELATEFGVSRNKIGRVANSHGLKTAEFGEFRLSKAEHSDKQVEQFYYNEKGRQALKLAL